MTSNRWAASRWLLILAALGLALLVACADMDDDDADDEDAATATPAASTPTPAPASGSLPTATLPAPAVLAWDSVNDFLYQLQDLDLVAVGNSRFDLVITDYSADGSEEERFTTQQIAALKNSPGGPKLVLAYMSIGEAETYRWYWQSQWDANRDGSPDQGAPSWLGPSNPNWPNNYKVRYWEPDWQSKIYGSPDSYLDKIIDMGFDGVYLDIIDGFEFWGPDGDSGLERPTAEREMVEFVKALAHHARVTRGRTGFGVFPQNGEALGAYPDYLQAVTGIGKEDTWYDGNSRKSAEDAAEAVEFLDLFRQAGKLVLSTDYVTNQPLIDDFYQRARDRGYVPYGAVKDLDALRINPGYEPD